MPRKSCDNALALGPPLGRAPGGRRRRAVQAPAARPARPVRRGVGRRRGAHHEHVHLYGNPVYQVNKLLLRIASLRLSCKVEQTTLLKATHFM